MFSYFLNLWFLILKLIRTYLVTDKIKLFPFVFLLTPSGVSDSDDASSSKFLKYFVKLIFLRANFKLFTRFTAMFLSFFEGSKVHWKYVEPFYYGSQMNDCSKYHQMKCSTSKWLLNSS